MKKKRRLKRKVKFYIVEFLFISLIIFSSINIIKWYHDNNRNRKILKDINIYVDLDKINTKNNKIDFKGLKKINNETVAYIVVNSTDISIPVVKHNDNKYYLNHNFKREYNISGWVFADYKNKFDGNDKNIILYGHNTKDGSMFGTLKNILKKEWYSKKENLTIKLITEQEESEYQVFSIYTIEPEDYYITTEFKKGQFIKLLNKLKLRSINDFKVDLNDSDTILTLSTCSKDGKKRVVLHAKKIEKE